MRLLDFLSKLYDLLNVKRCFCCREIIAKNKAFCPPCEAEYQKQISSECGICGKKLCTCSCSSAFLSQNGVKRMIKLFRYRPSDTHEHSLNLLLYRLKHHYVKDIHTFIAALLSDALARSVEMPPDALITFVPRTLREKRKYGFDQSAEIAKALSEKNGIPFASLLRRRKHTVPQKKMRSTEERLKNAKESYMAQGEVSLSGKTVLLIDDTVTTGASVAACARILRKMGAKEIIAVAPFISVRHKNLHYEHIKNSREERFYQKRN